MKIYSFYQFVLVLFTVTLIAGIADAAPEEDHPLLSRYEGSIIKDKKVSEFGQYKLVTGRTAAGEFEGKTLEGKVTRIVYQNPKERSTLEIFRNYQQAFSAAGVTTIYTCEVEACGPAYARSTWGRYNGLFVTSDGDPRYLSGTLTTPKGTVYAAVMVGKARTQLDIVEIVAMEENLVLLDASALAEGIDRDGKVSVYGIYFDIDKATIKPDSKPALDEIAKMLRERATLKLFVVGHTDMTGELQHNRTLSEARARSVVKALVESYGITAARLEGYGVGPLAPAATNANEAGRAKNRRVELVAR